MVTLFLALVVGMAEPAGTPFTRQVQAHFATWDIDHDGELEPRELDALVVRADIRGEEAAALGALKVAVRGGKFELPPLTPAYFETYAANVAAKKKTDPPAPSFDRSFARNVKRIRETRRDVFADGVPALATCRQGPLGDCFFVSVIGAALARDEGSIRGMIHVEPDGSCTVTFKSGKRATVAPLTDSEIALTSTTGHGGVWLAMLEKAFGRLRTDALPEEAQHESTTDAIAKGGSTSSTIQLLTGHKTQHFGFLPRTAGKKTAGSPTSPAIPATSASTPGNAPAATPPPTPEAIAEHLAATLPKVRVALKQAFTDHRLVTLSTAKEGVLPPGINPNHAYAVMAYDGATDTLTVWNPHGNTFTPKAEAGLANGYLTKAGMFTVPLEQAAHVFRGLTLETDAPVR